MTPPPPPGAAPGAKPEQPAVHHSVFARINDDLHKNPARYVKGVLWVAIPVLAAVVGYQFWRGSRDQELGSVATGWADAWGPDSTAQARAAYLEGLEPKLKTDSQKANRLFELTVTYKQLAEEATTQADKLVYYEKMLGAATDLKSRATSSLWAKMPTRPPTSASNPTPAAVEQLRQVAESQLNFLKAHPFTGAVDADPNLKVTVELEDGRKFVIGKFYSRVAPFHVQNFVELARKGYYEGTGFSKLGQDYKKGVQRKQGDKPSGVSIEGGQPMTRVTPDNRDDDDDPSDLGYSVREEPNQLPVGRGKVVAVGDPQNGGDSPSKFKIYGDEPSVGVDTVFAEVTEGLDVLDSLINAPTVENKPSRPRDLVRIKKMTVEGSVASPPERPFPPELRMPEGPKVESRPESGPETKRDEKKAQDGTDTKPK